MRFGKIPKYISVNQITAIIEEEYEDDNDTNCNDNDKYTSLEVQPIIQQKEVDESPKNNSFIRKYLTYIILSILIITIVILVIIKYAK